MLRPNGGGEFFLPKDLKLIVSEGIFYVSFHIVLIVL